MKIRAMVLPAALAALISTRAAAQEHGEENVRGRVEYIEHDYAYPNKHVPADVMQRFVDLRVSLARTPNSSNGFASLALTGSWLPLGPTGLQAQDGYYASGSQLDAGRISGVAIDPTDSDTWYLATASGGVWKTINSGNSWTPLTDSQCSLNVGAVALDPVNTSIVYAATGELNQWSFGCGVLRSANAGSAWAVQGQGSFTVGSSGGSQMAMGTVHVDPATAGSTTSSTVLIGGGFGVYRSTNSGASWTRVLPQYHSDVIVARPGNPSVLYATAGDGFRSDASPGVYKSTNSGSSWSILPIPTGITAANINRVAIAVSAADPGKLWAAFVNDDDTKLAGLFVWNEATSQWTSLGITGLYGTTLGSRGDFGAQGWYDLVLAVDPADAGKIFLGGVRMYRTLDGGTTWRQVADNIHVDWHVLVFDPNDSQRIVGGSDGGVFLSIDGGETWTSRNYGLGITQYYPGIAVHPTNPTVFLGGSQDNGSHLSYGMPVWEGISGGDGGFAAIDYADPTVMYTTCQWSGTSVCMYRHTSAGLTGIGTGIVTGDRGAFIPPLVIDPVTHTTLYFGTQYLYRSLNSGSNWAKVSTEDLTKGSGNIRAIAVAPSDAQTIYVGSNDGSIRVTHDGGTLWDLSSSDVPNFSITDIAVDPGDPSKAWATNAGFGGGHVWKTTNGGTNWTSITGNLPDVPVNAIVYLAADGVLLVGTEVGVYQSADNGATWQSFSIGLPLVKVTDLVYNSTTGMVVAGTFGRGMFRLPVAPAIAVLRGDVSGDGAVMADDALLIQKALIGAPLGNDGGGAPIVAMPKSDANCNNALEAVDALITLRKSVGITDNSCVGTSKLVRR